MNDLVVSEIQIIPVKPKDGLIAFASCVIDGRFYLGNIAVYTSPTSPDGYRLLYPIKVLPNGKEIHCVHPITKEVGEAVKRAIISKFEDLMTKQGKDDGKQEEPR